MCLAYDVVWRPTLVMLTHLTGPWRPGPTPLRQPTWDLTSGSCMPAAWSQQDESRWAGGDPVRIPTLSHLWPRATTLAQPSFLGGAEPSPTLPPLLQHLW